MNVNRNLHSFIGFIMKKVQFVKDERVIVIFFEFLNYSFLSMDTQMPHTYELTLHLTAISIHLCFYFVADYSGQ